MKTAVIHHADCYKHIMQPDHPEQPRRLSAINDRLMLTGLDFLVRFESAPEVTREQLEAVHCSKYLDELEQLSPDEGTVAIDDDTAMNPYTLLAARRSAGAGVHGVDLIMSGIKEAIFCNTRPPGHHAEHNRAMGFCFYNNIAVAAAHAMNHHGLERVAIIDFDVHHGNGTEDIFKDDSRVLFISSFQHPFYPYTSLESNREGIIKNGISVGTNGISFREMVKNEWVPAIEAFDPELLFISAGFDAHREDAMSSVYLTDEDYCWITKQLVNAAHKGICRGIVSTLEGGYDLPSLSRSVSEHVHALLELY